MKKVLFLLMLSLAIGVAGHSQTEKKTKPTSTVPQKMHNLVSKHKHHNGYKTKKKKGDHKTKHKHTTKKDIRKHD
jgi:hypothetical protein